ncbi:THAP domain-containing protein 5-like [Eriocheir sinensis]|uniref:THAP domain-containing protein 5-like n=1 Tax=Eriocheir sinensis TaxID=95602 RepID=UPI0021C7A98B|nr:THAP domain-containing protein 5-like [Eriocheir sinensis]
MPKNCAAVGCTNHNMMAHKKLSFCIFPNKKKQPERWRKWVKALNRVNHDGSDWQPGGKYVYLCSEHFMTGKPSPDPDHPDYLPTVFKNRPNDSTSSRKILRLDRPYGEDTSGKFSPPSSSSSSSSSGLQSKILTTDPPHLILTEPSSKGSGYSQGSTIINYNNHRFRPTFNNYNNNNNFSSSISNNNNRTMMYEMVDSLKGNKVDLKRKVEGFERQLAVSRYESSKCMRMDEDNWIHFTGLDSIIFQTFCTLIIAQLFSSEK